MGINIVNYNGKALVDLSKDTVTPLSMLSGTTAHNAAGDIITGNLIVGEQVNADWNAAQGAAAILNKPTLSAVATSGNYADLQNKPVAMTGATAEAAGTSGFVPAPSAGDENKVLKGDGTWGTIASRNIGETVFSLLPLSDAGLHLLDGSLLPVGGIYDEAITKIAALQSSNPTLFTTEENWQMSVSTYGVCGKFVYVDGVSLRLPKVTGFVEGTLDAGALGDLVEAGLPSIGGSFGGMSHIPPTGIFVADSNVDPISGASTGGGVTRISVSASSIYGNSTTVQPQAIKGYLYIVLATSTKTDVQVNIDNVATDLNGKADKSAIANMAMPCNQYVDLTLTNSGSEYTAPNDGWVMLWRILSANNGFIGLHGNVKSFYSGDANEEVCVFIPVRKGDTFRVYYRNVKSGSVNDQFRFYYAEGSKP